MYIYICTEGHAGFPPCTVVQRDPCVDAGKGGLKAFFVHHPMYVHEAPHRFHLMGFGVSETVFGGC